MLSAGANTVKQRFNLTESELSAIVPTGPLYSCEKRWVSREDVVKYIISKRIPIDNLHVEFLNSTRIALWAYEKDCAYLSMSSVFQKCQSFQLRPYQEKAVESCFQETNGRMFVKSSIIEAYCAAGKTFVGSAVVLRLQMPTVVVTTHCVSVQQWLVHFKAMGIDAKDIFVLGDESYSATKIPPITITTYTMFSIAYSRESSQYYGLCLNLQLYDTLLLLDEVHTASATTYQAVFAQRSKCIIGLTATLCREDDGIQRLYEHIGPVSFTIHANMLVEEGFISGMNHIKIMVPLSSYAQKKYDMATSASVKQNISIINPNKIGLLLSLLYKHSNGHILVFCDMIDCIHIIYKTVCAHGVRAIGPVTGQMSREERLMYFDHFEKAETACLFISKVGDNAIDLKSANVIIKLSTTSRSRNQEEQRNGRGARKSTAVSDTILYTLITKKTREEVFFSNRNAYLYERGFEMEYIDVSVRDEEDKLQIQEWRHENTNVVDHILTIATGKTSKGSPIKKRARK